MSRYLLILIAALFTLGACDSLGPDGITGTYDLETVNGRDLPFGFLGVQITGGSISLRIDRTYNARTNLRVADDGRVVTEVVVEDGTWERSGSRLTLRSDAGVRTEASLVGRTLTIDDGEVLSVYRR